jgi:signal transduction histidine kinase
VHKNLDQRIQHELEKVKQTLTIVNDNITIIDSSELKESDFYELTSSPYFLQIINNYNKIVLTSRNVTLFKKLPFNQKQINEKYFESFDFDNTTFRSGYSQLLDSSGHKAATMQISVYESNFQNFIKELFYFNIWTVFFFIIIVIVASIWVAIKTFKPINQIIETAYSFNVQNLNKRIDVKSNPDDEIGRLRDTLNSLFDRLENYVAELTYFSDHVSHQLMNPLTAISTEIEYLQKKDRETIEYKEALTALQEQVDSMISIIKTLLVIAKSGKLKSESKTVFNLSKMIKSDIYSYFKNYNVMYKVDENLYLRGESEKYLMVLQNLIYNAIKYSPDSDDIKVVAYKDRDKIILQVEDKGIGIGEIEKENVFQKFYRSDQAEKLGIKGFGLGLSLVKSIIDEVSGTIEIIDNKPNGTIFKIILTAIELRD